MDSAVILIVDDERLFGDVVAQRLRQRGFAAVAVTSGLDALKRLEGTNSIEVVLLDLKMPVTDGIATLQMIKKGCPLVEVVMLTGHATIDSAIEAMKSGAFDYLVKPFDIKLNRFKSKLEVHKGLVYRPSMMLFQILIA